LFIHGGDEDGGIMEGDVMRQERYGIVGMVVSWKGGKLGGW